MFAAIAYDWRPKLALAIKAYGWFLTYFFFVFFLNPLINGNYFYLKYRPFFDYLPDYIYIPATLIATLGIFILGYYLAKFVEAVATAKKIKRVV